ncbi:hypothetical protein BDB01DRAFT_899870 [Pilobolus umbonatus]|nr:hypothetical protein BDB01DRAFT_899870 [Pilobolus umbonatus]
MYVKGDLLSFPSMRRDQLYSIVILLGTASITLKNLNMKHHRSNILCFDGSILRTLWMSYNFCDTVPLVQRSLPFTSTPSSFMIKELLDKEREGYHIMYQSPFRSYLQNHITADVISSQGAQIWKTHFNPIFQQSAQCNYFYCEQCQKNDSSQAMEETQKDFDQAYLSSSLIIVYFK